MKRFKNLMEAKVEVDDISVGVKKKKPAGVKADEPLKGFAYNEEEQEEKFFIVKVTGKGAPGKDYMNVKTRATSQKAALEKIRKQHPGNSYSIVKEDYDTAISLAMEEIETNEALSPKEKEKRLLMIKKAVQKLNRANIEKAKKMAMRDMKASGMFDDVIEGLDEAKYTPKQYKMAFGVLNDPRWKGGNMTQIVSTIEKIAKGLSKDKAVAQAIQVTNEGLGGLNFGYRDNSNDGNQGPRVVSKQKQEPELERLKKKLEFHYNQQAVHDEARRKYRKAASEARKKGWSGVEGNEKRADEQEELAQKQMMKIQDIRDQIRDLKGKK